METREGGRVEITRSIDAFAEAFESDQPATMMRAFLERKR
jgi:hypothetical protein